MRMPVEINRHYFILHDIPQTLPFLIIQGCRVPVVAVDIFEGFATGMGEPSTVHAECEGVTKEFKSSDKSLTDSHSGEIDAQKSRP